MKHLLYILQIFGFGKTPSQFYGFGKNATGGDGGVKYYVSNENELRNAINKNHARIITLKSEINIKSKINIYNDNITLIGRGVNARIKGSSVNVFCKNFIFQNIHFAATDKDTTSNHDSLGFRSSSENGVVDRCIFSFGVDENLDVWGGKNITIQYCINAHALHNSVHDKGAHSMGMLIGANAKNISVLYNVFAHNVERNIRIGEGSTVECIGNIFYDYKDACVLSPNTNSTIINNTYLKGSQTPSSKLIDCTSNDNLKVYAYGNVNDYGAKEFHNDVVEALIDDPEIYSGATIPTTENALDNWIKEVNPKQPYAIYILKDVVHKKANVIDKSEEAQNYFKI